MTDSERCFEFPHVVNAQATVLEAWREDKDTELIIGMRQWCRKNVGADDWLHDPSYRFEFRHLEDAVRFELTWR